MTSSGIPREAEDSGVPLLVLVCPADVEDVFVLDAVVMEYLAIVDLVPSCQAQGMIQMSHLFHHQHQLLLIAHYPPLTLEMQATNVCMAVVQLVAVLQAVIVRHLYSVDTSLLMAPLWLFFHNFAVPVRILHQALNTHYYLLQ